MPNSRSQSSTPLALRGVEMFASSLCGSRMLSGSRSSGSVAGRCSELGGDTVNLLHRLVQVGGRAIGEEWNDDFARQVIRFKEGADYLSLAWQSAALFFAMKRT